MHIIIAPDSFKGTLSSLEAGTIIKEAALSAFPVSSVDVLPMADGGEGTVAFLRGRGKGMPYRIRPPGPWGAGFLRKAFRKPGHYGNGRSFRPHAGS